MGWSYEKLSEFLKIELIDNEVKAMISLIETIELEDDSIPYELLKEYLDSMQIIEGLNEINIKEFCSHPNQYFNKKLCIASGTEAIDGEDGFIEWVAFAKKAEKPKELEDGRVDYYSINKVVNVKKGELIARKVSAKKGIFGKTVLGKSIPAKNGKEPLLKPGKNAVLNEEKNMIYAAIDGQVVITDKNKINVFPVYEVSGDLDFSVGNIDFVGTVVIRGNVPDGFKIKAMGDIHIYGNVEGAELEADGNIIVQHGVIGHNKCHIVAKKNFKSSYILDGDVHAYDTIEVTQSIMHSQVSAGNKVICKGSKGLIVGGKIQAGAKVEAVIIGNELATGTIIEVGINPQLRLEMEELKQKKKELNYSLDQVTKGLNILERMARTTNGLTNDKKELQLKLINQQISIEKNQRQISERLLEIDQLLKDFNEASIHCIGTMYPGLKLAIGRDVKFIKQQYKHMKFTLKDDEIISKPL